MINKTSLWPIIGIVATMSVNADVVKTDDLIVQGATCVGFDCATNETEPFNGDELKLKENNTRIRMVDKSLPDQFGNSWNIEANDSANGGNRYFDFQVKQSRNESPFVLPQQENLFPETLCTFPGQIFPLQTYDFFTGTFPDLLTGGSIPVGGRTLGTQVSGDLQCDFSAFPTVVCSPVDAICVDLPGGPVTEPAIVRARMEGAVPQTLCTSPGEIIPAKIYDTSTGTFPDLLTGGSIPVGEDLLVPELVVGSCLGNVCDATCVQPDVAVVRSVLNLGTADNGEAIFGEGVAIGFESALEKDVVSVGRADLARRISHVAAGLFGTDVLTVAGLNGLSQQLAGFNAELDDIDARIGILESDVFQTLLSTVLDIGPGNSFTGKATNARAAYVRGNNRSACNILDALQNQIAAQTGKKISVAQAAQLNAEVLDVKNDIGCT